MDRCWLKGSEGDALHAMLCAAGFKIRWLLRAIARQATKVISLVLNLAALYGRIALLALMRALVTPVPGSAIGRGASSLIRAAFFAINTELGASKK